MDHGISPPRRPRVRERVIGPSGGLVNQPRSDETRPSRAAWVSSPSLLPRPHGQRRQTIGRLTRTTSTGDDRSHRWCDHRGRVGARGRLRRLSARRCSGLLGLRQATRTDALRRDFAARVACGEWTTTRFSLWSRALRVLTPPAAGSSNVPRFSLRVPTSPPSWRGSRLTLGGLK